MTVFDIPGQTIVNTVNCDGVMGKGLALEVKKRFPDVNAQYQKACLQGQLKIGTLQLVKTRSKWVLNFPTKNHWRAGSKLSYIAKGLRKFSATYKRRGITSIAFPQLGCGSGGLPWEAVRPVMERFLVPLQGIEIYVCLGQPANADGRPGKAQRLVRSPRVLESSPRYKLQNGRGEREMSSALALRSLVPEALAETVRGLGARFGIRNIRVFGSLARGEAGPESDVDLLVEYPPGKGGFAFVDFCEAVEELLRRKVDVVTEKSLPPLIRDRVLAQSVPL